MQRNPFWIKMDRIIGHSWNGCTCKRCGDWRDENHDWNFCMCRICRKERNQHDFSVPCRCSVCGTEQPWEHKWEPAGTGLDKCSVCGQERKTYRTPVPDKNASQGEVLSWAVDELRYIYEGSRGFVKGSGAAEPIREIGERLHEAGDFDLMKQAFNACRGNRNLELVWDGVGWWQG